MWPFALTAFFGSLVGFLTFGYGIMWATGIAWAASATAGLAYFTRVAWRLT